MNATCRCLTLLLVLLASAAGAAETADRLYLQSPFDEIVLDDANSGAVLRVQSLSFPGRRMPSQADRQGELQFDLIDRPGEKFAVPWANIVEIRFFEQLVLAAADQQVREGRYDVAQEYFLFLESKFPQTTGLSESIEKFLYVQVGAAFRGQRYDEALALLVELHGRNPEMKGVAKAYERVTSELVKRHLAAGNFAAARGLLKNLGERYPATMEAVVAPQQAQLRQDAEKLVAEAQSLAAAGKRREAHETIAKSLQLWPAVTGGLDLAQSIHQQYPVVTVGVLTPVAAPPSGSPSRQRIDDWAAARMSRLLSQPIAAPAAGVDGPAYQSPLGELVRGEDPRQLVLKLKGDLRWRDPPQPLTGAAVSRTLLAAADPQNPQFSPQWSDVLAGVSVSASDVAIEFLRPQPLPESLLGMSLWMDTRPCGPYKIAEQSPPSARFVPEPGYFAISQAAPAEIVERTYFDSAAALAALARGEISLIDRLSPWDVPQAAGGEIGIRRYAAPTVHVLLLNPNKPLLRQRTMRRALVYGIDRNTILRRGLLAGQELAGSEVISGPFPRGTASEPFAYAYDAKVEPKPYEPGTAAILARLAADEAFGQSKPLPPLVLAHPAGPIARVACQSIARQASLLNLQVTLREDSGDDKSGGEADLRYAELSIREPLTDAWPLLGPHGLSGSCSSAMLAALRDVEAASNKENAATALQAVHKLAAAELPVIPLWQLAEHCAIHSSVQGVAERPGSLYENIQGWQAALRVPIE